MSSCSSGRAWPSSAASAPTGRRASARASRYWFDGDLYLGMMWQSRKALDLVRDPRCVVHSTVSDKARTDGEFKAYGLARDVPEPARREKYCVTLDEQIGWRPSEPFHLFALDLTAVGYCRFADGAQVVRRWRPG